VDRQITFSADGRATIGFTVANDTDQAQPARDVYVFSTRELKIASVGGCAGAAPLTQTEPGAAWATTFKCALGPMRPHESRSWTASVEYLPAVREAAGAPRADRAQARLPLAAEADVSTFGVLVVPEGATDTSVILGRAGPLTLIGRSNNNDPSFIGYTVKTPVPGGPSERATTGGTPTKGGTDGGPTGRTTPDRPTASTGPTTGATTNAKTSATTAPSTPTTLPKTGPDDDALPLAGGAVGLMLVGNALFQGTRRRRIRSADADED
jgi:LPXTG-motif cell wall-anchored protein